MRSSADGSSTDELDDTAKVAQYNDLSTFLFEPAAASICEHTLFVANAVNFELDVLRSQYEAAFSVYQNLVAAVALAQGDDQGVPDELLSQLSTATEELRSIRRRYRSALMRTAFGTKPTS